MRRLLLGVLLVGCQAAPVDDDDTDDTEVETDDTDVETDDTDDTDVEPTCSAEDLCTRTIDECEEELTMETCLAYYNPVTTTCADIAAYEACNCDCIEEPSCNEYYFCGELCYADHCGGS